VTRKFPFPCWNTYDREKAHAAHRRPSACPQGRPMTGAARNAILIRGRRRGGGGPARADAGGILKVAAAELGSSASRSPSASGSGATGSWRRARQPVHRPDPGAGAGTGSPIRPSRCLRGSSTEGTLIEDLPGSSAKGFGKPRELFTTEPPQAIIASDPDRRSADVPLFCSGLRSRRDHRQRVRLLESSSAGPGDRRRLEERGPPQSELRAGPRRWPS